MEEELSIPEVPLSPTAKQFKEELNETIMLQEEEVREEVMISAKVMSSGEKEN